MSLINSAREFHILFDKLKAWNNCSWLGIPFWKLPMDAILFQKIIVGVKPDFIIETGTGKGGSAAFYASILELLGIDSFVVTIDTEANKNLLDKIPNKKVRDRIIFIPGDSVNDLVFRNVLTLLDSRPEKKKGLVFLDSWHTREHVFKEMMLYGRFVSVGSYLIVEDTHVNGNPINWEWGEGPKEAVEAFLSKRNDFIVDDSLEEEFLITFNPGGFLKRIERR